MPDQFKTVLCIIVVMHGNCSLFYSYFIIVMKVIIKKRSLLFKKNSNDQA